MNYVQTEETQLVIKANKFDKFDQKSGEQSLFNYTHWNNNGNETLFTTQKFNNRNHLWRNAFGMYMLARINNCKFPRMLDPFKCHFAHQAYKALSMHEQKNCDTLLSIYVILTKQIARSTKYQGKYRK